MMDDNSRKIHDFLKLSDIDSIQEAIEQDLVGKKPSNFLQVDQPIDVKNIFLSADTENFYEELANKVPHQSSTTWIGKVVAILLICTIGTGTLGFGLGAGWSFFQGHSSIMDDVVVNTSESATLTTTSYVFETVATEDIGSIADIVELLVPSVVGITTHRSEARRADFNTPPPAMSIGSGVIFAECELRIFIATGIYVVFGGTSFDISVGGSPPISAQPVGQDISVEVAVLSVYKSQLVEAGIDSVVIATFGDSEEMRVGDAVFAIGNAMDDGISVTSGVISAAQREFVLREYPISILQTDAALNYGSSGGPLINTRGEVIGINMNNATASIFGSSPVEGMGYSLASSIVAPILEDIISAPPLPGIGIVGGTITEETALHLGVPALGVYVNAVAEGGGAYMAGILSGDVITGFNGLPVFDMRQLQEAIRSGNIGDIAVVNVIRNGSTLLTFEVELRALVVMF
ncbi:MAG: S1C family serine protease [Defluviitaleaceae bacterium]|nr:S1C family serine protease [Defluviitaleaceae bacterium]